MKGLSLWPPVARYSAIMLVSSELLCYLVKAQLRRLQSSLMLVVMVLMSSGLWQQPPMQGALFLSGCKEAGR